MTSRTTPVGILVIALASLIVVGCSASTNAVFQALLDPAGTPVSSPEAGTAADLAAAGSETEMWWPHPTDGYEMDLPAGWSGVAVHRDGTDELVDAVADTMPALASRMDGVLDGTKVRVSAIAVDIDAEGEVPPALLVLAEPTEGKRKREVKAHVRSQITSLPNLVGQPIGQDVVLDSAEGVRFDYTIDDPDLGELRVRSYLVRFGRTAYLVNFVASAEVAEAAEAAFDEIADSLRFGV